MPQFMVSVQHPEVYTPPADVEAMMYDIDKLNEEMVAAGVRDFGGGLQSALKAKAVKPEGGKLVVSDGPYLEAKEYIGGFWLLTCADMDEAVEWAWKAAVACRGPIEVREFLPNPEGAK